MSEHGSNGTYDPNRAEMLLLRRDVTALQAADRTFDEIVRLDREKTHTALAGIDGILGRLGLIDDKLAAVDEKIAQVLVLLGGDL